MAEEKPLLETLEELYEAIETEMRVGSFIKASNTAHSILKHGDWYGFRILDRVRKLQKVRVASFYADNVIRQNPELVRFKTIAALYPDDMRLGDILSLRNEFGDCPELNDAMEHADYSHYLIAFEHVLGVARKLGLTQRSKEFLRAYSGKLGLYSTSVGFYGLESK